MADSSGVAFTAVKDMKPSSKNLHFTVMVLEPVGMAHRTKDGPEVKTFKVADRTGSINLCVFGENAVYLKAGDIVRVKQGYASLYRNSLTAYVGKAGEMKRIGEFCLFVSEEPNMSAINFFPDEQIPMPQGAPQNFGRNFHGTGPPSFPNQPPPFVEHGHVPMR